MAEAPRSRDVICLGRAAVDLYGEQVGGRLEDVQSFAKYLGGSSGNVAAGLARLGKRAAMLTRVGDEHMGRFVREALAREGVDVSHVVTDPERLTGLVILGVTAPDDVPHVFFRERCADLALAEEDFDEAFIASARMLAITGTHLSTAASHRVAMRAASLARDNDVEVVLDVDYRPVLWGLTAAGEGASRYVASRPVSEALAPMLELADVVVGTEEEIRVAGAADDTSAAVDAIRAMSGAIVVLKRGAAGCTIFARGTLDGGTDVPGLPVAVFNTIGAGDAFLAGFLAAYLEGRPLPECGRLGNACGALVVARHGCTPAMPSRIEVDDLLARPEMPYSPRQGARLARLHRTTTWRDPDGPLFVLAFDHRRQLEQLAAEHGRPFADIARFKDLVADAAFGVASRGGAQGRYGIIVDQRYGARVLSRFAAAGLWVGRPVEVPGSRPLAFDPRDDIALHLATWPTAHTIKCLLFYHPDDPIELRLEQERRVRSLFESVVMLERRLVLEIICPAHLGVDDDTLARTLRRFYNLGVYPDWWKLEPQTAAGWGAITGVIAECDPHCKGVVLLGLDADEAAIAEGFEVATRFTICRGFAVGRGIFGAAARDYFSGSAGEEATTAAIAERYARMIDTWRRNASAAA